MHQSRKEQGLERASRKLLQLDRHEATIMAEVDADIEAAEEWEGHPRSGRGKTLSNL